MMKSKNSLLVCLCGTSTLSNSPDAAITALIKRHSNARSLMEIPANERGLIEAEMARSKEELLQADADTVSRRRLSAELNTVLKWKSTLSADTAVQFRLLASDTVFSRWTGDVLREWLERHLRIGGTCETLKDLQTVDVEAFHSSLVDLTIWCHDNLVPLRENGWKVVFSLSGGFKSVQGFLQTLSMLYADETLYMFRGGGDLLAIPTLPVRFNDQERVAKFLPQFRRAALKLPCEFPADMPSIYILRIGKESSLSAYGELAWRQSRDDLYSEGILPSPAPHILYEAGFQHPRRRPPPNVIRDTNVAVDKLAQETSRDSGKMRPGILRPVKGNPFPDWPVRPELECDASNHGGAWRIYCRWHEGKLRLIALDGHL